jgi:hypothetical protein
MLYLLVLLYPFFNCNILCLLIIFSNSLDDEDYEVEIEENIVESQQCKPFHISWSDNHQNLNEKRKLCLNQTVNFNKSYYKKYKL